MVDRVELVELDQPQQVRELHRDHAALGEQDLHAADEVVEVGDVGEDVVAQQQVGLEVAGDLPRGVDAEELHERAARPRSSAAARDVGGRLDAEHRDAALHEVLQEVAVVGGELHDLAGAVEPEALDHERPRSARSAPASSTSRREVGVVAEDLVRRLELLELHEHALAADPRVQRVERLHRVAAVGRQVGVRHRRHAEVGEHRLERRGAESAGRSHRAERVEKRSIWSSVTVRTSSPADERRVPARRSPPAPAPRSHAGRQPSSVRAFVESSARWRASCGCGPGSISQLQLRPATAP